MSAIPLPSEEEHYLLAIFDDPSGIELAEFTWVDEEQEDGCFRAWDFQWHWYRNEDTYQIDYAGRSLGKSLGIQMRAYAFPFSHPGQEMLITAPELNHLRPVTDKVEHQILSHRLSKEMLPKQRGNGINHQPQFQAHFINNARIMSRLPQRDGKGVKGMHPLVIEADEMQDFPDNGWVELIETMKHGTPGAQWRCHGVSRGVRDRYYKYTLGLDPDLPFYVHRYMAMHRPTWSDDERRQKIAIYGGTEDNVDYRRNIYGEHGDATNPVFVLARLMGCVRINESPWATEYNEQVYAQIKINDELLRKANAPIQQFMDMPYNHLSSEYTSYWGGMDVGFCVDEQTEILTRRGWLTHDEVRVGDESLAIDPDTGEASWQSIQSVYRERFDGIPMVHMKGQSFDALTTPHHRWLTQGDSGKFRWRQTRTLTTKDRIPLRAPVSLPLTPSIPDALVELVAWYWTEGSRDKRHEGGVSIGQSLIANPDKAKRIEAALVEMWGKPGSGKPGPKPDPDGAMWRYGDRHGGTMRYFHIFKRAAERIVEYAPGADKVVTMEFLLALTASQLELFVEVSKQADGWDSPSGICFEQHVEARSRMFEVALVLSGQSASTSRSEAGGRERWHTRPLQSATVSPIKAAGFPRSTVQAMTISHVAYTGVIWCPTLKHHNWVARRNGSIYYTGNTRDPSELLIFGETPQKGGESLLRLLARIHLMRVSAIDQAEAVRHCFEFYGERLRCVALDKTGNGLPLWQELDPEAVGTSVHLRRTPDHIARRIKGYGFSTKIPVEFDDRELVGRERPEDAVIEKNVVDFATDELRKLVDARPPRIELPHDAEILTEWQGQEVQYVRDEGSAAGVKRKYGGGSFHTLDAAKMMIAGRNLQRIEEILKAPRRSRPTLDRFGV